MKLTSIAKQVHAQLRQKIIQRIDENSGAIHFSQFMQLALYTPSLGYYQNNLIKLGEQGDFVTAPEIGDLFAKGVARSVSTILKASSIDVIEYGAGSGILAANLLAELQLRQSLPEHYFILEPSASLQQLQEQTILKKVPDLAERVQWLSSFPLKFNGIILANEVLDAIPFELIQRHQNEWRYIDVGFQNDEFVWLLKNKVSPERLPFALKAKESFVEGYKTEIRPLAKAWIKSLSSSLNSGYILLFDYGYPQQELYHPQRDEGSLRCFSRHQSSDKPLDLVGLQDITAHVDFTDIAYAAVNEGLNVDGFSPLSGYLIENGILDPSALEQGVPTYKHSQQVQKLILQGQMGEVFKVLLLSKHEDLLTKNDEFINEKTGLSISGFSFQDHLYRL